MAFQHSLVGEHKFENLYLSKNHRISVLERIRDGYDMTGDVLLAGYPKSGTTWMQELLWLLLNHLNFEKAKQEPIGTRVPVIEHSMEGVVNIDLIDNMPRPRLMKSHLPARFYQKQLATTLKVVLLIRNPKDQLVSMFHFYRMAEVLGRFSGTWDEFFEMYKAKHIVYGDWFDWYREWLPHVGQENVKLVKYEDMAKDLRGVIREVAGFIGSNLDEAQVTGMEEHLSFNRMRDNKMINRKALTFYRQDISPFMRKGVVGDWHNYFSREQSDYVDAAYREIVEAIGITLQFD